MPVLQDISCCVSYAYISEGSHHKSTKGTWALCRRVFYTVSEYRMREPSAKVGDGRVHFRMSEGQNKC